MMKALHISILCVYAIFLLQKELPLQHENNFDIRLLLVSAVVILMVGPNDSDEYPGVALRRIFGLSTEAAIICEYQPEYNLWEMKKKQEGDENGNAASAENGTEV